MRDVGVVLGIEQLVVDAVDDPVQLVGMRTQQLVEPFTVLRGLDLGRIALAHCVDDVGEMDATSESIDHIVKARNACTKDAPPLKARQLQRAETVDPLGGKVVDGECGGDLPDRPIRVNTLDQVRYQGGKRVVDVDHIWEKLQGRQHLKDGAAEEN